jgi:hypothetical protein
MVGYLDTTTPRVTADMTDGTVAPALVKGLLDPGISPPEVAALGVTPAAQGPRVQLASALSPAFMWADGSFTAPHEGGKTRNDGTGGAAAYGIDQRAHPGMNVMSLTPESARQIRYGYWKEINGDMLARINPRLALIAYDTAIMSGPGRAKQMLAQSGGDAQRMLDLRVGFQNRLQQQNPAKYGGAKKAWDTRNADLARVVGGQLPPSASQTAAAGAPAAPSGQPLPATGESPVPPPTPEPKTETAAVEPPEPEQPIQQLAPQSPGLLQPKGSPLAATTFDRYQELLKQAPGEKDKTA